MSTSRRVLVLCRQSLTRDDSVSIRVQRDTMTAHYEGKGDRVVGVLESENTRGWKEDRADLSEAVTLARRGAYDVLAVWSIDRLARKVRILETVVDELKSAGVGFDSYSEPWATDPFMRQIGGAMAEKFTSDLARRMTGVVAAKVAQGRHQGPPPFGFGRGDDDHLVPNDDATAAAAMFTLRERGYGRRRIRDELNREYGVALDAAAIGKMLRNPAYAGGVRGPGGAVVWDAHEGIVGREQWDRVQALRAERPRAPRRAEPHWLEGIAFCGCDTPLYRNDTRPGYALLRCGRMLDGRTCAEPLKSVSLVRAEAFVVDRFGRDLAAVAAANPTTVSRDLIARQATDFPAWERRRADLERRRDRLTARRERILEQRADGLIGRDACRAKVAAIDGDLATVARDLDRAPQPIDPAFVAGVIKRMGDLATAVRRLDEASLRDALARVGARLVLKGEPTLVYAEPYAGIVRVVRA